MFADPEQLAAGVVAGERRAVARALSWVEDRVAGWDVLLARLFPHTGRARVVGITGAPGAGKSSLTDAFIARLRADGRSVAVVAVDPSSPFTGGAILGDRIRMQDHAGDRGVFIRSMSNRGHLGGLAATTPRAVSIVDAAGFDVVFVETVGVGQAEVEVASATDLVVVVVTPGWGDSVQANKAGVLEVGDVYVVNKADRPGVDAAVADLEEMLALGGAHRPVVTTSAVDGTGVDEALAVVWDRWEASEADGELERRRRRNLRAEVRRALHEALVARIDDHPDGDELLSAVERRLLDPWTAAERILVSRR